MHYGESRDNAQPSVKVKAQLLPHPSLGVEIEVPNSIVAAWWDRRKGRNRVLLLPGHGEIVVKNWCEGSALVSLTIAHPGRERAPVERVDIEGWNFNGHPLQIQPFFAGVSAVSSRQHTQLDVELRLDEGHINTIKQLIPKETLESSVARSNGLPFDQELRLRVHFDRGKQRRSELHLLTIRNVVLRVSARLYRTVADL